MKFKLKTKVKAKRDRSSEDAGERFKGEANVEEREADGERDKHSEDIAEGESIAEGEAFNPVDFDFGIITRTPRFENLRNYLLASDQLRDLTDADIKLEQLVDKYQYLKIPQKGTLWHYLRARASGTASIIGKYIKTNGMFPDCDQIHQAWLDMVTGTPYQKTAPMMGHMKWGVSYEDPALLHFCQATGLGVAQVGSVKVRAPWLFQLGEKLLGDEFRREVQKLQISSDHHFIISPDGLVYRPSPAGAEGASFKTLPPRERLVGFLEIKCASPFHYMESCESSQLLQLTPDIEARQWHNEGSIPAVYNLQMAMQSLAGVSIFRFTPESRMWLQRWTPNGFSLFEARFRPFLEAGLWGSLLYLYLYQNIRCREDLERLNYPYSGLPREAHNVKEKFDRAYEKIREEQKYTYYPLDCYPHFNSYIEKHHYSLFRVPQGGDQPDVAEEPDWDNLTYREEDLPVVKLQSEQHSLFDIG